MQHSKIVTGIEEIDKRRSKIYVDREEMFVLYKGEILQFKIRENEELSVVNYQTIQQEILPKRAKKRCLNLLQVRPYTEQKLREKLKEGYYPEQIIDEAIAYVKSYHYIDDYDYACQYIFYHKETEPRRKIEEKLLRKGIPKEILQKAMDTTYHNSEEQREVEYQQARKLLAKKHYDAEKMDWKEKQKIYAFLIRKGIDSQVIKKAMFLDAL